MEKDNKNINDKFITIFNFDCKDCHTKIGQFISKDIDGDRVVCPECKSTNTIYGTILE